MVKILVVEDDRFLRELIVRKLSEEGFDVITAVNGEEGLKTLKEKKPDLVLLDLILPGIDGFEVLKRLKEEDIVPSLPVIILSNLGQREDIEKGLNLGAKDYLIKAHFTPDEIIKKIKSLISK
ncbi:MAG: response regulator transcription factor [Minisyncoccia bacterium]